MAKFLFDKEKNIIELLILRWKLAYFKISYPKKYTEIINIDKHMEQTTLTIPDGVKTIEQFTLF